MSHHLESAFRCARRALAILLVFHASESWARPIVSFDTSLGPFQVELFDDVAPLTVQNFLGYVNRGDYDSTFIHRSVPNFVIQGGGYRFTPPQIPPFPDHIPTDPPIVNEFHLSNTRGTIAMAKTSDPNSATSEWFFNLADNPALDDPSNSGGFTVFGRVLADGMNVVDSIAAVPRYNAGGAFAEWPLRDFLPATATKVTAENLVLINHIALAPEPATLWVLFGGGCAALVLRRRRTARAATRHARA